MHRPKKGAIACRTALLLAAIAAPACSKDFDGKQALEITRKVVDFGPRPPGSPAIHKLQAYLLAQLKPHHCEVSQDDFTAQTPNGAIGMKNIIARFAANAQSKSGRAIVLTGHYDTKLLPNFVGADDGGSSTGFLL